GEGEMLGMAFFKSLVKHHGRRYFEPIGKILAANHIRKPNFLNPVHLWKLKGPMWQYSRWLAGQKLRGERADLPEMPRDLRSHARSMTNASGTPVSTSARARLTHSPQRSRISESAETTRSPG